MQEEEKKTAVAAENEEAPASDAVEASPGADAPKAAPTLEEKLKEAEAKAAAMQDAFLRAKAEGENIRRRAQDDVAKAHKFAIESFAESMLTVADSLDMALKIETLSVESLKEGVEMTVKQMSSAFEKNRLTEVNPAVGEKLDPMKHQAISTVPSEQESNTVVSVLQKGYMITDRLLRPAIVTVAETKTS